MPGSYNVSCTSAVVVCKMFCWIIYVGYVINHTRVFFPCHPPLLAASSRSPLYVSLWNGRQPLNRHYPVAWEMRDGHCILTASNWASRLLLLSPLPPLMVLVLLLQWYEYFVHSSRGTLNRNSRKERPLEEVTGGHSLRTRRGGCCTLCLVRYNPSYVLS